MGVDAPPSIKLHPDFRKSKKQIKKVSYHINTDVSDSEDFSS